ncbi:MAG: hypothetical protein VX938_12525, partial [Myxococcota bacterium]|nr:hypothetical protein [Myxococcota bacterium]
VRSDPIRKTLIASLLTLLVAGILTSCSGDGTTTSNAGDSTPALEEWACEATTEESPDFLQKIGCTADFEALASEPLDASIPGARSTKTVIDRMDDNSIYFQNSRKYAIHWEFATEHLSVPQGLPPVPSMAQFNNTEYYSPDRRFLLGAVTWYEEPGVWVYEISPYDTASAEMITQAYDIIAENAWFGSELYFHPTSQAVGVEATKLPDHVRQLSTDELFAGISFQPLNLGTSMGFLRFLNADGLASESLSFRDIVVLDHVPNDIGVVSGIITAELQTPLSHINVLSQNRGTPNMALIGAFEDPTLTALDGRWVEVTVGAFDWSIKEVTQEEADTWWEGHKP